MKPDSLQLQKLYALTASSCLCAGGLLILKSLWDLFGMPAFSPLPAEKLSGFLSPAVLLLISFLCLFLLKWSSEKKLRLPLWGGLLVLALLAGAFLFFREKNAFAALSPEEASLAQTYARSLSSLPQSASSARILQALSARTALQLYFFLLVMGGAVLLCGLLAYLSENRLWLKGLLLLIQIAVLLLCALQEIPLTKWNVLPVLFCLLLFLSETAACFQNQGMENQAPSLRKSLSVFLTPPAGNLLYLAPVFLAAVLIIGLLPAKEAPMHWDTLRKLTAAAEDKASALIIHIGSLFSEGQDSYALSFTGYTGSGHLNGGLFSSSAGQLSLTGSRTKSPLYLNGTVHDFYNGHGWEQRVLDKTYSGNEYLLNYQELTDALAASVYTSQEQLEMIRSCRFDLRFEGLKTQTVFYPPFTGSFFFDNLEPDERNDSILLPKAQSVGFTYSFLCMDINWGNEKVQKLLRQEAWAQPPVMDEEQQKRERYIYQHYTELPDTVPQRVYALAEEITEGLSTDYDRMKAIEGWLNRLTYTTSPPQCPEGQDFTDYFLFDSQTGYCTYFATAMAVLGRCCGIPTRYAEGFVTTATRRTEGNQIMITSDNAHAWAEGYLPNIGWVPFEPTPRYYEAANTAWNLPAQSGTPAPALPAPENQEGTTVTEAGTQDSLQARYLAEQSGRLLLHILEAALLIAVLLLFLWLFFFCRSALRQRSYRRLDAVLKLENRMRKILQLGEMQELRLEAGETLAAYRKRADGRLDTASGSFGDICTLYQSIRFGGKEAGEADIRRLEQYVDALEKQYLHGCGRLRRLLYHMR
ncbi:DUF4129 domain-containing transglutaminase family protein [Eisenbergiella sp.]